MAAGDVAKPLKCPTCFLEVMLSTDLCPRCGELIPYPAVSYDCIACPTSWPTRKLLIAHHKEAHGPQ